MNNEAHAPPKGPFSLELKSMKKFPVELQLMISFKNQIFCFSSSKKIIKIPGKSNYYSYY